MRPTRSQSPSYWKKLLARLKQYFGPKPEPEDPYAYRTAPLRPRPHSRIGAAVAELDEE
jgi:hypothetical protein